MIFLTIVAAMDNGRGIGIDNKLPWDLPEDLANFKKITMGQPIIMGRKTFEAIGRPLPGRQNIVVTRNLEWTGPEGLPENALTVVHTTEEALKLVEHKSACVIGGAEIYAELLPRANRMILTRVHGEFTCDAFFPEFEAKDWKETWSEPHISISEKPNYSFMEYHRRE